MNHRSKTSSMLKLVSLGSILGALVAGAGCGPQKYVAFQVWEGPSQASDAKKMFIGGIGGYHDEVWALLEKNDVDGAIKAIEADPNKGYMDYYNLAVLYEVKHDWAKAEEAIQAGIKDHAGKFNKPDDQLQTELAYIQDHRARYVGAPAAAPAPAAPAAPAGGTSIPSMGK